MTHEELVDEIARLWGVANRTCDGNHPRNGCDWEKVLRTAELVERTCADDAREERAELRKDGR